MILVLSMCAVMWIIGAVMGAPKRQRWSMIAVIFAAVILIQLTLPPESPLRQNTGGSWTIWALIAGFGAIVVGYRTLLRRLRAKAQPSATPPTPKSFSDTELERYARHIVMREIGGPGQKRLKQSKVLVIGAGGLGSPVLQYLAAAGVGTIGIVDDDVVDASNLQRQIIHRDADIGRPKVTSAAEAIRALNPYVGIKTYIMRLDADTAAEFFPDYDMVIDGTDNFETRYLVNAACVALGKPLVSGALSQWEGQVSIFHPANSGPCYQCIFPTPPAPELAPSCAEAGVFTALPGIIGTQMAAEALKYIIDAGTPLIGRLSLYDALDATSRVIKTKPRGDCPICHSKEPS